jgi:hypothetical protein
VHDELWANERIKDTTKFVRSELWSEYNPNVVKFRRSIPDTIYLRTKLRLPVDWMGESLPTSDTIFYLKIVIQLKYGDYDNCIEVINPKLTKEYEVNNKKVSFQEIVRSMQEYGTLVINSDPILLKIIMRENNIGFMDNNPNNNFLCQIIIKTYLGRIKNAKDCIIEYIHFVCAPIPHDYIINEW